jgi:hypothetical protein
MRRLAFMVVFAVAFIAATGWAQESRRIRRIPVPPTAVPADAAKVEAERLPPPPSRPEVENAARQVADAYGHSELERMLARDFPNREELLDALRRIQNRATDIRLYVESVERVEIGAWQVAEGADPKAEGQIPLRSTCVVDVRTRLTYDDPDTGQRVVRDVGRAQWVLRFEGRTVR